jgi:hypothetical protein
VSESPPRNPFENGPYIRIATLCEALIEERDGLWTVVRMLDRMTRHAVGPQAPGEMEPFTVSTHLALHIDTGEARGNHEIAIRLEAPSGLSEQLLATTVTLESADRGVRFHFPGQIAVTSAGLYWFIILFDNQVLTRVPLRILYERLTPGAARAPQA